MPISCDHTRAHRSERWARGLCWIGAIWLALGLGIGCLAGCDRQQSPEEALLVQLQALTEPTETSAESALDASWLAALKEADIAPKTLYEALFSHFSYSDPTSSSEEEFSSETAVSETAQPSETSASETAPSSESVVSTIARAFKTVASEAAQSDGRRDGKGAAVSFTVTNVDLSALSQKFEQELLQKVEDGAVIPDDAAQQEEDLSQKDEVALPTVIDVQKGSGSAQQKEGDGAQESSEAEDSLSASTPLVLQTLVEVLSDPSLPTVEAPVTVMLRQVDDQWYLESPEAFLQAVFANQPIDSLL